MKIKVAAIQTKTFLEADEQTKNIEKAREYVAEAADLGAKFVCFPETYPGPWKAPLSYSPVEPLQEVAGKHDVYIVAGANCPVPGDPGRGYTSQILVGPDGSVGGTIERFPRDPGSIKGVVSGTMITRRPTTCRCSLPPSVPWGFSSAAKSMSRSSPASSR